jgi:hypothetical protein
MSEESMNHYANFTQQYGITLLDELHNFFPALLYDPGRFRSVQDVLRYIREEAQMLSNPFQRGQNSYNNYLNSRTSTDRQIHTRHQDIVTETYEFTMPPLFHEAVPPLQPVITAQPRTNRVDNLLTTLLSLNALGAALDPVIVRPTIAELEAATTLRAATTVDEGENCSICQDHYTDGQAIRTISHCHHAFHKNCIDTWFQRNVHCPVCRYDIRETV